MMVKANGVSDFKVLAVECSELIDTVVQQKMTANIWEMAGEEVKWDKL